MAEMSMKRCNPELKAEAIKLVNEQGQTLAQAGEKLGIPKGTITSWVSDYTARAPGAPSGALACAELKNENVRLRKELADTRLERELPKSGCVLCEGVDARYAVMKENRLIYPVKLMAKAFEVLRSEGTMRSSCRTRAYRSHTQA